MTTRHAKETQDLIKVQGYSMQESLKGHYEYIGTSKGSDKVTYQCKYCGEEKSGRKNTVGNFKRHLELVHKNEYEEHKAKRQRTLDSAVSVYKQQHTAQKKIPLSSEAQRSFNKYVAEMVALDGFPLSATKGLGFRRLVAFLKPELNVPSPRTVKRQLEDLAVECALPALNNKLSSVPSRALHFIVDLWTSRSRQSILGIRVQFVDDWRLRQFTLSFRHIEGRHTGDNIRETFLAELAARGVGESQVGTIVCDNAANMNKAFNMTGNFSDDWMHKCPDPEDCNEDYDEDCIEDSPEETPDIEVVTLPTLKKVSCAAHTLQLAVNSALRQDDKAQKLLSSINEVINLFRRSCYWTERLREVCSKDLVPASGTRWNSIVAALKRLIETDVFDAVISVVQQYNDDHPSKLMKLTAREFNITRLQALHSLLKPLADATDRLQSDGVTSGELHLTICQCYTQVKDTATEFTKLKKRLLKELNERFEGALHEAHFVAASVLNPRQKLRVFHPSVAPELKKPTADEATNTIRKLLKEADAEEPEVPSASQPGTSTPESDVPASFSPGDPYAMLDVLSPAETSCHNAELDNYLKSSCPSQDPLSFWKENEQNYPKLAKLARIYLGVPASSGSVERLFSVSGALQRARRASLLPQTIEQLVIVAEHVKSKENSK